MSRVRTPTVLQMEAVECGAASLSMILAHFGRWVPLERLREDCGISRDGSKASYIAKAARAYGLECHGYRREPEHVKEVTELPAIVFWNFNHFVVLEGFSGDRVFLNDPARGPVNVSWKEFDESFTGVILEFGLTDAFQHGGEPPSIVSGIKQRLNGIKDGLLLVALIGVALVIPGIVIPVFSQIFVDEVLIDERHDWLPLLLLAMACTALVRGALTWIQYQVMNRMDNKLTISWTCRLFDYVLKLPMPFFSQRFAGDISARLQANDNISTFIGTRLSESGIAVVTLVFYVMVMMTYDFWLTMVSIIIAGLNVLAMRWSAEQQKLASRKLSQDEGKLFAAVAGGLGMVETLKATGTEHDFFSRVAGHQARIFNSRQLQGQIMTLVNAIPATLTIINTAVILGLGGLRVMEGAISMGMLVAFQSLTASFMSPVQQLVGQSAELQQLDGDMSRVDDVFKYPVAPRFSRPECFGVDGGTARLQGKVELRDLVFGYSNKEPPLIENFNLSLLPGKRVALVGGSGSGKSTLARLISGLAEPWSGEILFDDELALNINNAVFNDSIAVVNQEVLLFEGSIRDNLTMWDSTIPDRDVIRAAKDAAIHDVIAGRQGAYDSLVAEAGANFSGGQAQRLEIARALVRNPSILILDEATSALDPHTEQQVDECLRRRGCTCIIVAHRLSTIRDADEIIVLDQGKVVERGAHTQMMATGGRYSELISGGGEL